MGLKSKVEIEGCRILNKQGQEQNGRQKSLPRYREQDISKAYSRFYVETLQMSKKIDDWARKSYSPKLSLEVAEKIDENKALIIMKARQDQCKAIENDINYKQFLEAKATSKYQLEQINTKKKSYGQLAKEDKNYNNQLKERDKFISQLMEIEKIRNMEIGKNYLQALKLQIEEKKQRKVMIKRIDSANKKLFSLDSDQRSLSPFIHPILANETSKRSRSPSNFLAQYGNFMLLRGKNN
ncbi:hypothetical protein SteCoe_20326 [Stentor coeruleus]|uniref:Uncharacterized protein n=1 Tax=Stentor coeruleus TaxID=5963 RepID=A0A1R2BS18_9CILI|nr:hypothetical protein SteCoe_20326 [Stentor coeruleus]